MSQLFVKDLIWSGSYTHPTKGWTLDVTPERMDKWIEAFDAMRSNGVDIEVPVDHSLKAEDNKGYVRRLYREGDTLFGEMELRGDGVDIVRKNRNVSIFLEPDVKDGRGNVYGEAITHVALVQKPVIPGQGDFVPIAASAIIWDDQSPGASARPSRELLDRMSAVVRGYING
jgi:hypothetical protein